MKKCAASYHLWDKTTGADIYAEGTFKGIQLIAEKSNNKNVTKIIGLEAFIVPKEESDEQMNGFGGLLQQKFACSVNIQNLPGKNSGKVSIYQFRKSLFMEISSMSLKKFSTRSMG